MSCTMDHYCNTAHATVKTVIALKLYPFLSPYLLYLKVLAIHVMLQND